MNVPDELFIFADDHGNKISESRVFQAFYELEPNFAGRPITHSTPGANPPDILCRDLSGKRIGVELTGWRHQSFARSEKEREKLKSSLSRIVQSECEAPPRNIEQVRIELNDKFPPPAAIEAQFREELFDLIRGDDMAWDAGSSLQPRERFQFPNHPTLSKYVAWIRYYPLRPGSSDRPADWIQLPAKGSYYDPATMFEALRQCIRKKIGKYATLPMEQRLEELYLVVYYSEARLDAPPYDVPPDFGFREIAAAAQLVLEDAGPFHKIFLFSPVERSQKVVKIWPQ
jgi:hypothetical protein